jgi:hypothetical protein
MYRPVQMEAVIGRLAAADPDQPAGTWQTPRQALEDGFRSMDRRRKEYGPLEPERFSMEAAQQPGTAPGAHEIPRMKFRVEVICVRLRSRGRRGTRCNQRRASGAGQSRAGR